jgi:general secretion pathway protein D
LLLVPAFPQSVLAQAVGAASQPAAAAPADAATQPANGATTRPGATTTGAGQKIQFNFNNATPDAVLNYLSSAAGFVIIKPNTPIGGPPLTIYSRDPVTPADAVIALNAALQKNGYTVTQTSDKILTVVELATYNRTQAPVHMGADPDQIANSDDIITQVIPVLSVDAVRLRNDLIPLLSPSADSAANAASNSIIITDKSANIKRAVQIISSIDRRTVGVTDIINMQLQNADATSAATLITTIFRPPQQQGQGGNPFAAFGGGGGRGGRGGGGGGGNNAQGVSASNPLGGQVQAAADSRTNTIVVTGPKETLVEVKKVLVQLDKDPTITQVVFHYPLRNAQAVNLQGVLNALFNGTGVTGNTTANRTTNQGISGFGTATTGGGGRGGRGGTTGSSFGSGFGGGTTANRGGTTGGGAGFGRGGGTGFGGQGGRGTGGTGGSGGSLVGQAFVVADADTNSLIVTTATQFQQEVRDIIADLDRPVPQVVIKVLIAEVTHNNSDDIGLEFSAINTRLTAGSLTLGTTTGTNFGVSPQTGGLVVGLVENNVNATLRALATAGKLDVLSRPYILASDNQLASMIVGQEVPIITDSRLDQNSNPINIISYRELGIILNVTPHINPEGLVIMDVAPEISQISDQSVPISNTVNAPVFNIRAAQTRVAIENGKTIVIGGLMQDQRTQTVSKIPVLGDIPWIGMAFKRTQNTKQKTELLIFLTPHVAQAPEFLQSMSDDERRGMQIVPNAVSPGSWDEQLRGLQRGATPPNATTMPNRVFNLPPGGFRGRGNNAPGGRGQGRGGLLPGGTYVPNTPGGAYVPNTPGGETVTPAPVQPPAPTGGGDVPTQ